MPRKTTLSHRVGMRAIHHFNEAAARCRGKPGTPGRSRTACQSYFNEAAARCRGKP